MEFCQDFQNLDLRKAAVRREETGGFGEDLVAAAAEAVDGRVDVVDVVDIGDGEDLDGMLLFVLEKVSLNVAAAKELAVAFVSGFLDAAELRGEERIELRAQGRLSREELTIIQRLRSSGGVMVILRVASFSPMVPSSLSMRTCRI